MILEEGAILRNVELVMHKFSLSGTSITLPAYTNIRHAGLQDGMPMLWAEVPEEPMGESMTFTLVTIGTGMKVPENGKHMLTYADGSFIWHVYIIQP
jgi:hypothetical protein